MTAGLRRVGNYEEVLAQAIKDEQHINGIISPYLQNEATRIINNPLFQRVKDRLEDDLTQQTRDHAEQRNFETHVHGLAVEAKINKSDLEYIINNLQQPPPPPAPPPPPNDAVADQERLLAELDGMAQERERQSRRERVAQESSAHIAVQERADPLREIIREFHHVNTPIYVPTPQVPARENYSDMMRQFGMTMQQVFMQQQQPSIHINLRNPQGEIPIEYSNQDPPPGHHQEEEG